MKVIRLVPLIILSAVLVLVSRKINLSESIISANNLDCLFGIIICFILFCVIVLFYGRLVETSKKLRSNKQFILLLICFGLMCCSLVVIVYDNSSWNYLNFFSSSAVFIGCIFLIRDEIRNTKSKPDNSIC